MLLCANSLTGNHVKKEVTRKLNSARGYLHLLGMQRDTQEQQLLFLTDYLLDSSVW